MGSGGVEGGQPHGQALQLQAQDVGVEDFVMRKLTDAHAAVRHALGQAGGDQQVEGFAHRGLADTELGGQFFLAQPLAGGVFAGDEARGEQVKDLVFAEIFCEEIRMGPRNECCQSLDNILYIKYDILRSLFFF